MKDAVQRCLFCISLGSVTAVAQANYLDLTIDAVLTGKSQFNSFSSLGPSRFDLLDSGDAISISLRLDTSQMALDPLLSTPGHSVYTKSPVAGMVVVDSGLRIGESPYTFSLLDGPDRLHSNTDGCPAPAVLEDCIKAPDKSLPEGAFTLHEVNYQAVSLGKTDDSVYFAWELSAFWIDPVQGSPNPEDLGYFRSDVSFALTDPSFQDISLESPFSYTGGAEDLGQLLFENYMSSSDEHSERLGVLFDITKVTLTPVVAPIPEVETWVMLAIGGIILGWRLRRDLTARATGSTTHPLVPVPA